MKVRMFTEFSIRPRSLRHNPIESAILKTRQISDLDDQRDIIGR